MAITRKPQGQSSSPQIDVDALINKGGSVATSGGGETANIPVPIMVRIPKDLLIKIDEGLSSNPIKKPRHTWLLEAIVEKLNRETG